MGNAVGVRRTGAVALVTGASGGIGRAIAIAMARCGFGLCLVGRDESRLAATVAAVATTGVPVVPALADLTHAGRVEELGELVDREFGRLDALVHAAGGYSRGEFRSSSVDDLDALYQVNVRAPYRLTQVVLDMVLRSHGDIVFVNSTQGEAAKGGLAQHAAMQHAAKAMADSLRAEVNRDDVRVTTIHLGRTATPLQERIVAGEGRDYRPELLIQPHDVAELVVAAVTLPKSAQLTTATLWPTQPGSSCGAALAAPQAVNVERS